MYTKCPKCRLIFNVNITSELTDITCVCPRCGMPYNLKIINNDKDRVKHNNNKDIRIDKNKTTENSQDIISKTNKNIINKSDETHKTNSENTNKHHIDNFTPTLNKINKEINEHKRHNYNKYKIILFIFIIIFIIIIIRITSSSQTNIESQTKITKITNNKIKQRCFSSIETNVEENLDSNLENNIKIESSQVLENSPDWLQGDWYANTDKSKLTINIRGNVIAIKNNKHTLYGSYTYEKNKLICKFNKSYIIICKLDMNKQKIIINNKILMQKKDIDFM